MNEGSNWKIIGIIVGVIIVIFVILSALPFTFVGAGERGVIFNNATGVENRILGEGFHLRMPFIQSVHTVSIKVQKNDIKAEAASKDLQTVNTDVVVNWHLDAGKVNKVYQEIGDLHTVVDRILSPAVSEVVKASVAKYTAENIIAQRPLLKMDIDKLLGERLTTYFIILDDVSIVNIDFSKEFNVAIENKQIADQDAKRSIFVAEKEKNEATARVNKAVGEADAQKLQIQSLTPELLQKIALDKWSGVLPIYMGSGAIPFLNINK